MLLQRKLSFLDILALFVLASCFAYLFYITGKPQTNSNNIGEIKTAVIAMCMLVLNFYFGSSRASAKKDETIQSLQQNQSQGAQNATMSNAIQDSIADKIKKLRKQLDSMDPESIPAKELLSQIETLEKLPT